MFPRWSFISNWSFAPCDNSINTRKKFFACRDSLRLHAWFVRCFSEWVSFKFYSVWTEDETVSVLLTMLSTTKIPRIEQNKVIVITSSWTCKEIKEETKNKIPVNSIMRKLNTDTAVAAVRPRKTFPNKLNPVVNRQTSPIPKRKDAIHNIGRFGRR